MLSFGTITIYACTHVGVGLYATSQHVHVISRDIEQVDKISEDHDIEAQMWADELLPLIQKPKEPTCL